MDRLARLNVPGTRRRVAVACALALLVSTGCARAPRQPRGPETLAARHAESRARREMALAAARADLVVRLDGRATGRLPAFAATLALAAPERARLQAHGLLGVAFEVGVRGDSVVVRWPAERAAFVLGGAGETLGIARPAEFLARAIGATCKPPVSAWSALHTDSAVRTLAWRERGDSLELALDGTGKPRAVRLARGGTSVEVRYDAWARVRGHDFPSELTIRDDRGWLRARVVVDDLRFASRPEEDWFDWRIPEGTRVLGWKDARTLFQKEVPEP